ncbi:MAG: hypothetical protein KKH28_04485 [Elusimicrobia bacterium]|nr:hypothetical protein [Elusimicrobiota bacterium]
MGIASMIERFGHWVLDVLGFAEHRDFEGITEVKTVHASNGVRRLRVYRCTDGAHCFREDFYNTKTAEMRWEPVGPDYHGEFASVEAALEEARRTIPWLSEELPD